jgi:hypothetical protein
MMVVVGVCSCSSNTGGRQGGTVAVNVDVLVVFATAIAWRAATAASWQRTGIPFTGSPKLPDWRGTGSKGLDTVLED